MSKLKYKKIKKITGDLISVDNEGLPYGLLRISFGFVEGISPFKIIIDEEFSIIYTTQHMTTSSDTNKSIKKLRRKRYHQFVLTNNKIKVCLDVLFTMAVHKPVKLYYYRTSNLDRLRKAIEELGSK